jgi:hypothetical protein
MTRRSEADIELWATEQKFNLLMAVKLANTARNHKSV